ncbi:MAG TPA: acyl-CoA dehydrogenase family protein, partial [Tepidisphaeraceae bacterium]
METFSLQSLYGVLDQLRARADQIDQTGQWPQQDLQELAGVGAMRWIIPAEFGGEGVAPLDLHKRYQAIASASLTTALILTQRDSAANIINSATAWPQRAEAMRRLAANEVFTTVGIAQLTTSRQRGAPALAAKRVDGGYELNGEIPWATGASHAEFIIAGAVLQDRNQILFALPMDLPGVRTSPPLPLVALAASHTSNITCDAARLPEGQILHGPVEQALSLRSKGVPIGQAFLALGLCDGAIRLIRAIDSEAAKS